jgi:starch-binding outer membrane protein, SusD/RagB family
MKKTIFLTCILLMQLTACNDKKFFELQRPIESPWTKLEEFDRAPIGAYAQLFSIASWGGWGNNFNYWYLFQNAVGDDIAWSTPGDNAWGWYRDTENNKSMLDNGFTYIYVAISSINDALQFVEDNGGDPFPKISSDDKTYNLDRCVGELHFLRGFAYYMIATLFCDAYVPGGPNDAKQIPLRMTKASSYGDATSPKIGTVQEVWDQIIADFEKAYELLPERFMAGKMHPSYQAGRANKFAAAAMLCRSYFAMGNYAKAKENASFVIDQNGGDYDLSEDPIEAFNKSTLARGKETIMYIPCYDETYGQQNLHATCFTHLFLSSPCDWTATHMDYATLKRIGWMDDVVNDTTINIAARRDKRFQQLIYVREPSNVPEEERIPERYYETRVNLTYRTVVANKYFRGPNIGYTNVPQIRLAEMYLTRSIISFKDGDKTSAASDLNIVRKRAWDENVAGESYEESANYVTSANITEQMIGDERIIEMFCEGDRINYLRGLKVDIAGDTDRAGDRGGTVPYTSNRFVWPVPVVEKSLDSGYK